MPSRFDPPRQSLSSPPRWLIVLLSVCVALILLFFLTRPGPDAGQAVELTPSSPTPAVTAEPIPEPFPTPTLESDYTQPLSPENSAEPDWTQPVSLGEAADAQTWFDDAVFIGDSRTDGFHLYSGVTGADFLDYNGISVYDVMNGKKVIRSGSEKISILEALAQKPYGKVYISLGVNELGYNDASGFAQVYGQLIDAVRDCQSDAILYVQSIIPVNTAKCNANGQPYYITNEAIASYNEALAALCAEKKVFFVNVSEALVDETGEVSREDSSDGVHFQKSGYVKWRDYLLTHTGI